jgi:CxxC motif-containing protein (DUF1111 family)
MKPKFAVPLLTAAITSAFLFSKIESATGEDFARDPGVRGGAPGAGGPIAGLTANERRFFEHGKEDFEEVEDVADGLGPRMNLDGCGSCHSQPAIGGTSPAVNPQVAFARAARPSQLPAVAGFIRENGPIREVRLVRNPDGTPDGGVTNTFTITGREGADGCNLRQHDFAQEIADRNIIFRIPSPVFGAGLIEQIPGIVILASHDASAAARTAVGIAGRANGVPVGRPHTNGNDGTVSRFGWKAQDQSLLLFSGEAYNVEMGVTNELFQSERDETPGCQFAGTPNSVTNTESLDPVEGLSSIQKLAFFMRFLAAPRPSPDTPGGAPSIARGRTLFEQVGCALCHTPTLQTGPSSVAALSQKPVNLYSDLLLHDMGAGLADDVVQGRAGSGEFRTAPLWGLGQRIFFLHDGRTRDLLEAIEAHRSGGGPGRVGPSEATVIVKRFNGLTEDQKQDVLNFLRSL